MAEEQTSNISCICSKSKVPQAAIQGEAPLSIRTLTSQRVPQPAIQGAGSLSSEPSTSQQDSRHQNVDSRQTSMQAKDYAQMAGKDINTYNTYKPNNTTVEGSTVKDAIFGNVKVDHHYYYSIKTPSESAESAQPKPTNFGMIDIGMIVDLQECNEAVIQSFAKHFPVVADFCLQPIGTSSCHALGRMLQHVDKPIEELNLWGCDLTSQGFEHICEGIGKMPHKLKELNLSRNQIQNAGVKSLSEIVHKLEKLWLVDCGITDISPLTVAIKNKDCKLKVLDLSNNQIQNAGVKSLSEIVHKLEALGLWRCGITDISPLTDAIKNKDCKIKLLVLRGNRIDDEGALELSRVLPNIERLEVGGCGITEEGEEVIRSKLRELGLDTKVRFRY